MWTERHRARHAARLKHMVSDRAVREVANWLNGSTRRTAMARRQPWRWCGRSPGTCGSAVRGPRGFDAAKPTRGRRRVAMVDADGHWLAVAVVPTSVRERDTLPALDHGKTAWPSLRAAILDGALAADRCHAWSNLHGMRHEIITRQSDQTARLASVAQANKTARIVWALLARPDRATGSLSADCRGRQGVRAAPT